ncbi:MAG TPA: CPBP family intramembrane glutamic endopeptidase [Polyangiaceae bacterium]|nr:CPBP family intramembrane glutamic endopeptidase [Polyangiaceae bacterium]
MTRGLPLTVLLAFGWSLTSAAALSWLITASVALRPSAATDIVHLGGIEALVFVTGVLVIHKLHLGDTELRPSLGLRATHPLLHLLALLLGFSVHFPAEAVDALLRRFSPETSRELAEEAALLTASSPARLVLVLLVISCIGPLVEELFFRGALFGALRRRYSALVTTLVTSFCFVIAHLAVRHWPALLVVSLALTYVRASSGSLLPSIGMHVAFNALTVISFATGQTPLDGSTKLDVVATLAGTAATLVLLLAVRWIAAHAPLARRGRAEDAE